VTLKRHLSRRAHREVKASPRLEIWRKATVARIKTTKEGRWRRGGGNPAAAARGPAAAA
jgi:hypothetical protein